MEFTIQYRMNSLRGSIAMCSYNQSLSSTTAPGLRFRPYICCYSSLQELVSSTNSKMGFLGKLALQYIEKIIYLCTLVCNVECGSSCLPESTSGAPPLQVQVLAEQLQLSLNEYVL